jgi:hypothetical protein
MENTDKKCYGLSTCVTFWQLLYFTSIITLLAACAPAYTAIKNINTDT